MDVMTENKVVPKLRFLEFNDNWQQKTLGDVGGLINGLTYSPKDITDDGVLVLRSSNVQNNQLSFKDNKYVNVKSFNPVKENDILICVRNGSKRLIGKNCLIDKKNEGVAFGAFMTIYRSVNNKFIVHLFSLSAYYKKIHQNLGATINSINNNDFKKFKFFFPSLPEQQKIASFLSAVDEKLQQLTKKKDLLEEYKKGVMQKIFSQELRFKDDNGNNYPDWQENKLGNIATFYNSKRVALTASDREKGEYPYYGASGIIDYVKDFIFEGEYILLGEDGANIVMRNSRLVFLAKGKFWLNNHAHIFQSKDSNAFLCEALERINYTKYNTGTAQPKLNSDVVKKIKLNLPSSAEQQKIANFLSALDVKIELVITQIVNTQSFKKGLLQQMFVAA